MLLKGKDFQPPFSGVFSRNLSELKEVVSIIKKRKPNVKLNPRRDISRCPKNVSIAICNLMIEFLAKY